MTKLPNCHVTNYIAKVHASNLLRVEREVVMIHEQLFEIFNRFSRTHNYKRYRGPVLHLQLTRKISKHDEE